MPFGQDGIGAGGETTSYGGANFYDNNYSLRTGCTVQLSNCTFTGNSTLREGFGGGLFSAGTGGAEYYMSDCIVGVNDCEFTGNLTGTNGGAQYFSPACTIDINNCDYTSNSAGGSGGGLYPLFATSLNINNSRFTGNSATSTGGGLFWDCGGRWGSITEFVMGSLTDPCTYTIHDYSIDFGLWSHGQQFPGSTATIENSYFVSNTAAYGGALYWNGHGDDTQISVPGMILSDCVIRDNMADQGGGLYWMDGAPLIQGCVIERNRAEGLWTRFTGWEYDEFYGGGGGIFCWTSDPTIKDCRISENSSSGSGGGVYFGGGESTPLLKNCLVTKNSAVIDGGGIVSYWQALPTISNCTIAENICYDVANQSWGRGGGLSCSYESQTTLIDSILWGNTAINGDQIALGSDNDPRLLDRPAKLTVLYCDIEAGLAGVFNEYDRELIWGDPCDANSIPFDADPCFIEPYYLSHIDANQTGNSPCIDAGSDDANNPNIGLDTYTTRTDSKPDVNTVDYWFSLCPAPVENCCNWPRHSRSRAEHARA